MAVGPDKYPNFDALSRHAQKGRDYNISVEDRGSAFTVLAIHGGTMKIGTSEITRAIAGKNYNSYTFDGNSWDLHITSRHFDEPQALELAAKSRACITIHGLGENKKSIICLGGLNEDLKKRILRHLPRDMAEQADEELQKKFAATSKDNIANRCADGGVQIELSTPLRELLTSDPASMQRFASAIRQAMQEYAEAHNLPVRNNKKCPSSPQPKI